MNRYKNIDDHLIGPHATVAASVFTSISPKKWEKPHRSLAQLLNDETMRASRGGVSLCDPVFTWHLRDRVRLILVSLPMVITWHLIPIFRYRHRSLVYKRHVERPQRPWTIWSYDVGKQLVGGFFVHFANILVSSVLQTSGGDQCAW